MTSKADIEKIKLNRLSVAINFTSKIKSSCWKYFGDLVLHDESNTKRIKILDNLVFCNVCLTTKKEDFGGDITFGS